MNRIKSKGTNHLLFFDMLRSVTMPFVVLYHAVAAMTRPLFMLWGPSQYFQRRSKR